MATADLALLLLVAGLLIGTGVGASLIRSFRRTDAERRQEELHAEALKQERLRTEILEEQLKNEILKDLD